jgi:hypothetical protein
MKLPLIHVPISVKVVAQFLTGAVATGLAAINVYEVPPAWTAFIATGTGLLAGVIVDEGSKYVQYWLDKAGFPVKVDPGA